MTPAELAGELVRRGCRVVVKGGVPSVRPPDEQTAKWVRSVGPLLRDHRAAVIEALSSIGSPPVPGAPPECNGRRCGACGPLRIVPPGFEAFKEFRGCHYGGKR
jgi:ferredoxin